MEGGSGGDAVRGGGRRNCSPDAIDKRRIKKKILPCSETWVFSHEKNLYKGEIKG